MGRPKATPEDRQPITDRKLRVVHILLGSGRGLYSPVQVGCDGKGNVDFQGRPLNDYTNEEFEALVKPFEERIRDAQS